MKRKSSSFWAVLIVGVTMLGLSLSPVPALAVPILVFDISGPSGTISYGGGPSDPLIGLGISVESVKGLGTPANPGNPGKRDCLSCTLVFMTGLPTGLWTWGGGGSIVIAGTFDLNNNHVVDGGDVTGSLLAGSFGTADVGPSDDGLNAESSFGDTKLDGLTGFYGLLPGMLYHGSFDLTFDASGSPGDGFTGTVLYGDVSNRPVPEPASLLLLGSGLVGLGLFGRKKLNALKGI